MAILTFKSEEEYEKILEPYALEIGKLVFSWNRMQEKFGKLYWAVLGKESGAEADEKWNSLYSDREQRKLLRGAAIKKVWPETQSSPTKLEDIEWLLDQAETLAEKRNDAVHASYVMLTDGEGTRTVANSFSGNRRAKNLEGKELLQEFPQYRVCAERLAQYAQIMQYHLNFPSQYPEWPARPILPRLD